MSHVDVLDVRVIHFQDHPVSIQRCDLEKLLTAFYCRADRLTQVAGDDNAIERRDDACAQQLLVQQFDLGGRLIDLRPDDIGLGAFALGKRTVIFRQMLSMEKSLFRAVPVRAE